MIYRAISKPVPPGFRETFLTGGWKAVEKRYGASNAVIMQWIVACGGRELQNERRAVQKCGRKAGGRHAPYSPQDGRTDATAPLQVSDSLNGRNAPSGACGANLEVV